MLTLFKYNWQVRDEWLEWCKQLSPEELLRERAGGVGSILRTLFHIVDVEQAWIRWFRGEPEFHYDFSKHNSLDAVRTLSGNCRPSIEAFVIQWSSDIENNMLGDEYTYRDAIRHVVAHEIHHIGQMSVWSRELGLQPISANLIGRKL